MQRGWSDRFTAPGARAPRGHLSCARRDCAGCAASARTPRRRPRGSARRVGRVREGVPATGRVGRRIRPGDGGARPRAGRAPVAEGAPAVGGRRSGVAAAFLERLALLPPPRSRRRCARDGRWGVVGRRPAPAGPALSGGAIGVCHCPGGGRVGQRGFSHRGHALMLTSVSSCVGDDSKYLMRTIVLCLGVLASRVSARSWATSFSVAFEKYATKGEAGAR